MSGTEEAYPVPVEDSVTSLHLSLGQSDEHPEALRCPICRGNAVVVEDTYDRETGFISVRCLRCRWQAYAERAVGCPICGHPDATDAGYGDIFCPKCGLVM